MLATPALADTPRVTVDPLRAYARARAADADGQVAQAAAEYGAVLAARPDDPVIAVRALREGLASGDMALVRRAGTVLRAADVAPADVELLAFADAVAARDATAQRTALARLQGTPIAFLAPMLAAWTDTPPGIPDAAGGAVGRRYAAENRALRLLSDRATRAEGLGALRTLLGTQGGDLDLRLNAAQLLARGGDRTAGQALLAGNAPVLTRAAARLGRGMKGDARFGISRLYARMAGDLSAEGTEPLAIMLTRSALVLDPRYSRARLALADALARSGADDAAQAALAAIPADDPFASSAAALRITILARSGDLDGALALAAARAPTDVAAQRRYADLLLEEGMAREAAAMYADALRRLGPQADWTLLLQYGAALDQAGQWGAALPMLQGALVLAPQEPMVLNYLGYAMIEHGGDMAKATALLEQAHRLAPRDAAITDSLGWARFRQGNVAAALPLIEEAARAAPDDLEINEHLGDVYWAAGRRVEARYAWTAAATFAEGPDKARLAAKLANGPAL